MVRKTLHPVGRPVFNAVLYPPGSSIALIQISASYDKRHETFKPGPRGIYEVLYVTYKKIGVDLDLLIEELPFISDFTCDNFLDIKFFLPEIVGHRRRPLVYVQVIFAQCRRPESVPQRSPYKIVLEQSEYPGYPARKLQARDSVIIHPSRTYEPEVIHNFPVILYVPVPHKLDLRTYYRPPYIRSSEIVPETGTDGNVMVLKRLEIVV